MNSNLPDDKTAVTVVCPDFRHAKCAGCECECHADDKVFAELEAHAESLGLKPHLARDLLAHLRSGYEGIPLPQAARVARYVIDLGWRPSVGHPVEAS